MSTVNETAMRIHIQNDDSEVKQIEALIPKFSTIYGSISAMKEDPISSPERRSLLIRLSQFHSRTKETGSIPSYFLLT
jgi:hypothetical protein